MINFLRRKKGDQNVDGNLPQQVHLQQQTTSKQDYPHAHSFLSLSPAKADGSVALYFASPHDIPIDLRDSLTGFDAASTYLTEKEIKALELYAGAFEDLELAMKYRPAEIDCQGHEILKKQMQKSLYAKLRLCKSKHGQLLNLAVKTIQEFKHLGGNEENGKSRWRRLL